MKKERNQTEEHKELKQLLGDSHGLTPDVLAITLAHLLEQLQNMKAGESQEATEGHPIGALNSVQQYATPTQLARMLGADKVSIWRQLKQLEAAGQVDVICFQPSEKGKAYPRYKVSDVLEVLRCNAKVLRGEEAK